MVGNKEFLQNQLEKNFSEKFNLVMDDEQKLFLAEEIVAKVITQFDVEEQILWVGFQKNIENLWSVVPVDKEETKKFWKLFSVNASLLFMVTNTHIFALNLVDLLERQKLMKVRYKDIFQVICGPLYSAGTSNQKGIYLLTKADRNFEIRLSDKDFQSLIEFLEENKLEEIDRAFIILEQESVQEYWTKVIKS